MKPTSKVARNILLTGTYLLSLLTAKAQVIQEVQNSVNLYKQSALQEKLFVHTDKTTYLPGEILWLKVYCVDGYNHRPLNLSKVVYVEVLDNTQAPVIQAKILMKNGSGNGSLYIPVSISNGNYKLRAYTNWMKNFSPDFYFEKMITLVNPLKSPEASIRETVTNYDVQFFPEGGSLVSGIPSKVAFKAAGSNGKGVSLTGVIVDQGKDTIAAISSFKFGMGNFSFTPVTGHSYKAVVKIDGQKTFTKDLPEVNSQGYVMNLTDDGGGRLHVNVKTNVNGSENVYLFAHTGQVIKMAEGAALINGSARFAIDKSALGEGITHFTVFNSAKQPVAERLYFKRPAQQLFIAAAADQQNYNTRKKVTIGVQAKDRAGNRLTADLSMSVYRIDSLQGADRSDIVSYLWLGSDLRGNIEEPGYYFNNITPETDQALDNLLLTQGWRRFQWSKLLENKPEEFSFLPEYNGHIITAKIANTETGAPAKNILTYLGIPGKRVQLYTARSDSSGRLIYNTKAFYGSGELIDQTNTQIDSLYRIDIASPFSEQFAKTAFPKFSFSNNLSKSLQEHSLGVQVLNIYSSNQIKRFYDPDIDSSAFYGKPYKTYKLDDFVRFTTMEEDLREYVQEDNIVKSKGRFHIKVLSNRGFLDGGDPLVLLDGIPVFNIDKIFTVDPLRVQKLEVVPTPYYYGPSEEEGIFSFTTYKGDLGGVELDPHAVVIDYEGLQLRREFYSPVYDTQERAASRIPDFRNLLFWSPAINTKATDNVSFYTSDQTGKYIGMVQGVTSTGQVGVQYFTFDVK